MEIILLPPKRGLCIQHCSHLLFRGAEQLFTTRIKIKSRIIQNLHTKSNCSWHETTQNQPQLQNLKTLAAPAMVRHQAWH